MSVTLTYGLEKPQTGDLGSSWFTDLENDITQLDGHTHNGTDSALLPSSSVTTTTASVAAGSWVATTGGTYRQAITFPAGFTYGTCYMMFILTTLGHQVFPTVEKISSTQFYVYTNDNSLAYTVLYIT